MNSSSHGSASPNRSKARWLAVTVPLLALTLGACGSAESAGSAAQESAKSSTTQTSTATSSAGGGSEQAGFATPEAATKAFVTRVVQKRYDDACAAIVFPEAPDNKQKKSKQCKATPMLNSLHTAWAKQGVALPPDAQVQVTKVSTNGDTATVQDTDITLDGHTLREIELMGATGKPKSFKLALKLKKTDGAWFVSDLSMDF